MILVASTIWIAGDAGKRHEAVDVMQSVALAFADVPQAQIIVTIIQRVALRLQSVGRTFEALEIEDALHEVYCEESPAACTVEHEPAEQRRLQTTGPSDDQIFEETFIVTRTLRSSDRLVASPIGTAELIELIGPVDVVSTLLGHTVEVMAREPTDVDVPWTLMRIALQLPDILSSHLDIERMALSFSSSPVSFNAPPGSVNIMPPPPMSPPAPVLPLQLNSSLALSTNGDGDADVPVYSFLPLVFGVLLMGSLRAASHGAEIRGSLSTFQTATILTGIFGFCYHVGFTSALWNECRRSDENSLESEMLPIAILSTVLLVLSVLLSLMLLRSLGRELIDVNYYKAHPAWHNLIYAHAALSFEVIQVLKWRDVTKIGFTDSYIRTRFALPALVVELPLLPLLCFSIHIAQAQNAENRSFLAVSGLALVFTLLSLGFRGAARCCTAPHGTMLSMPRTSNKEYSASHEVVNIARLPSLATHHLPETPDGASPKWKEAYAKNWRCTGAGDVSPRVVQHASSHDQALDEVSYEESTSPRTKQHAALARARSASRGGNPVLPIDPSSRFVRRPSWVVLVRKPSWDRDQGATAGGSAKPIVARQNSFGRRSTRPALRRASQSRDPTKSQMSSRSTAILDDELSCTFSSFERTGETAGRSSGRDYESSESKPADQAKSQPDSLPDNSQDNPRRLMEVLPQGWPPELDVNDDESFRI